jgi:hypothetical protein
MTAVRKRGREGKENGLDEEVTRAARFTSVAGVPSSLASLRRWRPFVASVPPTLESFRTLESIRRWHLYVAGIYKPLGSIWKGA